LDYFECGALDLFNEGLISLIYLDLGFYLFKEHIKALNVMYERWLGFLFSKVVVLCLWEMNLPSKVQQDLEIYSIANLMDSIQFHQ